MCSEYLEVPSMHDVIPDVSIISPTSVKITYKQMDIKESLAHYYDYVVQYKTKYSRLWMEGPKQVHRMLLSTEMPSTESPVMENLNMTTEAMENSMENSTRHNIKTTTMAMTTTSSESGLLAENKWKIIVEGLEEGTQYSFRIQPFRDMHKLSWSYRRREPGIPSKEVQIKLHATRVFITNPTTRAMMTSTTFEREQIVTEAPEYDLVSEIFKVPAIYASAIVVFVALITASVIAGFCCGKWRYTRMTKAASELPLDMDLIVYDAPTK